METLRKNISDTVNELNKLLKETTDPEEEEKLRKLRGIYFKLWEEVIKQEIDNGTQEFKEAIDSLKVARDAAVQAKEDLQKVAEAIDRAVSAAKAVDRIVKLGIDFFA
jgi:uncharacterized protein YnzC (UPF0291/DUF896 family)